MMGQKYFNSFATEMMIADRKKNAKLLFYNMTKADDE